MALKFWTNQTVGLQSALGAAVPITNISKAANGVITTSGAAPANGSYVLLEVQGMQQVHRRVFKTSGLAGLTFQVGEDTTLYGTFVSGTFRVITFGAQFDSLRDPQGSGGDPVTEDTTTIHDVDDTEAIVSSSAQGYSFTADWEPTNAALIEANKAFITRTPRAVRVADPDGSEYLFYASVSAPLNPIVSGRKKVTPLNFRLLATGKSY